MCSRLLQSVMVGKPLARDERCSAGAENDKLGLFGWNVTASSKSIFLALENCWIFWNVSDGN